MADEIASGSVRRGTIRPLTIYQRWRYTVGLNVAVINRREECLELLVGTAVPKLSVDEPKQSDSCAAIVRA